MASRVVVAPHCDDETMGMGGTIAKYPDCTVVVVATPDEDRFREFKAALAVLGHTGRSIAGLGFGDGEVGKWPMQVVDALDKVLEEEQPVELFLPYPGSHQDHIAVYEAGVRTARHSLNPKHWMPRSVLVYETPAYEIDLHDWPLRFSVFEVLTQEQANRKAAAMEQYASQTLIDHPGSPAHLRARAHELGLARGVGWAEQFAPIRMVRW